MNGELIKAEAAEGTAEAAEAAEGKPSVKFKGAAVEHTYVRLPDTKDFQKEAVTKIPDEFQEHVGKGSWKVIEAISEVKEKQQLDIIHTRERYAIQLRHLEGQLRVRHYEALSGLLFIAVSIGLSVFVLVPFLSSCAGRPLVLYLADYAQAHQQAATKLLAILTGAAMGGWLVRFTMSRSLHNWSKYEQAKDCFTRTFEPLSEQEEKAGGKYYSCGYISAQLFEDHEQVISMGLILRILERSNAAVKEDAKGETYYKLYLK